MPCCNVQVCRANARPRRVSVKSRSRNVALRRSMSAVLITPSLWERYRIVSTHAAAPPHEAARDRNHSPLLVPLDDLCEEDLGSHAELRTAALTTVSRLAEGLVHCAYVGTQASGIHNRPPRLALACANMCQEEYG